MSVQPESEYVKRPAGQIVKCLGNDAQPGSHLHEEIKGALYAVLTENLTASIDRHEKAATRLGTRLLWLNYILVALTVVGTVLAILHLVYVGHL